MSAGLEAILTSIQNEPEQARLLAHRFTALVKNLKNKLSREQWFLRLATTIMDQHPSEALAACKLAYLLNSQNRETLELMHQALTALGHLREAEAIQARLDKIILDQTAFGVAGDLDLTDDASMNLDNKTEYFENLGPTEPLSPPPTEDGQTTIIKETEVTEIVVTTDSLETSSDLKTALDAITTPALLLPENLIKTISEITARDSELTDDKKSTTVARWLKKNHLHTAHLAYLRLYLDGLIAAGESLYAFTELRALIPCLNNDLRASALETQLLEICRNLGYRVPSANEILCLWTKKTPELSFSSSLWISAGSE